MTNKLKNTRTNRGFSRYEFKDQYGVECSLQESSLATENCIWLGANDINLKVFWPYLGWHDIDLNKHGHDFVANTRMHLTQNQVKLLLPILQKFVKTGKI
jgi:hypothetical protein